MELKKLHHEHHAGTGSVLSEVILGGQDGIVNVLGIVLGVGIATQDPWIVIIAGLAATFAESLSMAAVAFTSTKASKDFYESEKIKEIKEIEQMPETEKEEIKQIFSNWGFDEKECTDLCNKFCSNKKAWLALMMQHELHLEDGEEKNPIKSGIIVGLSAFAGSIIPLIPIVLLGKVALIESLIFSLIILFAGGMLEGKLTAKNMIKSGATIAFIGGLAALGGFAVGWFFGIKPV